MYPKFHIGPMSKNTVDAIIEFCNETNNNIGFIPSRRQIEYNGGYVNKWSTHEFSKYVNNRLPITRDHAGPNQGCIKDNGYKSLMHDCSNFNMIHIDPWIKYPKYEDGLQHTIEMIEFIYKHNPRIEYEVGTEESIRKFKPKELNVLLNDLYVRLEEKIFNQIKYVVVQSGTSLEENTNTGKYNSTRLSQMIQVVKKYNKLTKEHNGDYLPISLIKEKFNLGLDSINLAPEFGQIETKVYLNKIKKEKPKLLNLLYGICYDSNKWKKWVNKDFNPLIQKEKLINICGHYNFSNLNFKKIKNEFPNIDIDIKNEIKIKLNKLHE